MNFLLFDLDGTLVDTRLDLAHAVNYALERVGAPLLPLEKIVRSVGGGVQRLMRRCLPSVNSDENLYRSALAHFHTHYQKHCTANILPYPQLVDALKSFSPITMAVLTNKPDEYTHLILDSLEIRGYFPHVMGGDSAPALKPDPGGLLELCARAGKKPGESLFVGDSAVDVLAARAAGVNSAGHIDGMGDTLELRESRPDFLFSGFPELVKILEKDYILS